MHDCRKEEHVKNDCYSTNVEHERVSEDLKSTEVCKEAPDFKPEAVNLVWRSGKVYCPSHMTILEILIISEQNKCKDQVVLSGQIPQNRFCIILEDPIATSNHASNSHQPERPLFGLLLEPRALRSHCRACAYKAGDVIDSCATMRAPGFEKVRQSSLFVRSLWCGRLLDWRTVAVDHVRRVLMIRLGDSREYVGECLDIFERHSCTLTTLTGSQYSKPLQDGMQYEP